MRILPVIRFLLFLALSSVSFAFLSSPIDQGSEFFSDLNHGEIVCRTLTVPESATRVWVKASVVGLTGNPNIFGGWDQKEIMANVQSSLAPTNAGGYHIFSESCVVPPEAISYYVCVTTFSTQGSDFVLTASIWDAYSWTSPHATLIDGYPTVWRLDDTSVDYVDFRLPIQSQGKQLSVSVTPLSGEVDIRVSDCLSGRVFGVSSSVGADILSLTIPPECESVCIRAHGTDSEFALVATTNPHGPFVAQSIPISGKLPGVARAYFNAGTDVIVQTTDELKITMDVDPEGEGVWSSSGLLEVPKSALQNFSNKNILYIKIHSPEETESDAFTLSVTTFNTVEQLEDGKPTHVTIDTPNRFRDFRIWVPKTSKILTIQGDSSEDGSGLGLFASTVRTSHDPRGYLWNTMTGTNDLVLTTDESISLSQNIPFIEKCEFGCYVYLSVKSCAVHQGLCKEGDSVSKFTLTASLDSGPLLLEPGRESRAVFSGRDKRIILVSDKERSDQTLFMYVFVRVGRVTITVSDSKIDCESKSRCVVAIDPNNAIRGEEKIEFVIQSPEDQLADITVSYRYENDPILLKNHHPVSGRLSTPMIDRYEFVVPKEAENSMVEFNGPDGVTCTVCEHEDCTSIQKQGIIHLKKTGDIVGMKVVADSAVEDPYTLTASFFSSFNSLRVGYLPVRVAVEGESKMSWQIGYSESSEWLVTIEGGGDATEICIDDIVSPRCCEQGSSICILQGFGRQVVWINNKSTDRLVFTLQAEELVGLQIEKWIDVKERKSRFFKLPMKSVSRVDTDSYSSVEYLSNSIENPTEIGKEYPTDFKGEVFARIPSGALKARLVIRETLFADHWIDNSYWSIVENVGNFFVRVESCGGEAEVVVNGNSMESDGGYVDITDETSINVEGSKFRVGLITGQKIDFDITLSAIIDPLVENSSGFIYFTAPTNADKTTYRALCLSSSRKLGQCTIEHSPDTIVGTPTGCSPGNYCEVPLPNGCEGYVTVVADKGTAYGAFAPIPVRALLGEELVDSNTSSGFLGFIGWTLRKLLYIVAVYVVINWVYANRILLRIATMRIIDFMRGKKKRGDYLLVEEMSNIESGGYKAFDENAASNRNLNHRSTPPPLIRAENHEMYHLASSNRIYHGA